MYFPLNKDEHPENHLLMVGERLANQSQSLAHTPSPLCMTPSSSCETPKTGKLQSMRLYPRASPMSSIMLSFFSQAESRSSFGHQKAEQTARSPPTATGSILAHNSLNFPGRRGLNK